MRVPKFTFGCDFLLGFFLSFSSLLFPFAKLLANGERVLARVSGHFHLEDPESRWRKEQ